MIHTSMAQAFTSAGDGYVLRGNSFEWDESRGVSPHLDRNGSAALMRDVLNLYKTQNRGSLPSRMVVHKSSRFWDGELEGFSSVCEIVPRKDFVALGGRNIQFYRTGDYPPVRGTFVKFSDTIFCCTPTAIFRTCGRILAPACRNHWKFSNTTATVPGISSCRRSWL